MDLASTVFEVRRDVAQPVATAEAGVGRWNRWGWLVLPALLFRSFTDPDVGLQNYARLVRAPLIFQSFATTARTALVATMAALVIGYPYAYLIYIAPPQIATGLQLAVLIPSWLSFVVRTYALTVLLRDTGVVNTTLIDLGFIGSPLPLIRNQFAVMVGMLAVLLPYMILPIYAVMRRIDRDYSRAAAVLGASPFRTFVRVILPLSMPGVLAGSVLVVSVQGFHKMLGS
jgi:putative spermidine/putrescine transport system permease protein